MFSSFGHLWIVDGVGNSSTYAVAGDEVLSIDP